MDNYETATSLYETSKLKQQKENQNKPESEVVVEHETGINQEQNFHGVSHSYFTNKGFLIKREVISESQIEQVSRDSYVNHLPQKVSVEHLITTTPPLRKVEVQGVSDWISVKGYVLLGACILINLTRKFVGF